MLYLLAVFFCTPNTKTLFLTPIQTAPNSETPVLIPTSNCNLVLSTFEDSKSDLSDASLSDKEEQNMPKRSAHTGGNQVDYKRYFQKNKAAIAKINLSVSIGSPYSELSCILFDFTLN